MFVLQSTVAALLLAAFQNADAFHAPSQEQRGLVADQPWLSAPVTDGPIALVHDHLHDRSLQTPTESCESQLEATLGQTFGGTYTTTCTCSDDLTTANCLYKLPETCDDADCSLFECADSTAATSNYCVQIDAASDIAIQADLGRFRETARTVSRMFPTGVSNVCIATDYVYFEDEGSTTPTGCDVQFDGVDCNSCTICTGNATVTRSIDCSNIDADAVDMDCVAETDFVDAQVLTFDETADCAMTTDPPAMTPTTQPQTSAAVAMGGGYKLGSGLVMGAGATASAVWAFWW